MLASSLTLIINFGTESLKLLHTGLYPVNIAFAVLQVKFERSGLRVKKILVVSQLIVHKVFLKLHILFHQS